MTEFKVSQVQRSIQKFRDYTNYLITSDMNTFDDRLNVFVNYCKENPVFSQLHNQLMEVDIQAPEDWYNERIEKMNTRVRRADLSFPPQIDARIALQYRLLHAINTGTINLQNFNVNFFGIGLSNNDLYIQEFCKSVISPLCRELDYRLQEIEEELPEDGSSMVSGSIVQIIHNRGTLIQQTATGSGNIQTSTIHTNNPDLERLVAELREEIISYVSAEDDKESALEIVDSLQEEAKKDKPRKRVMQALLNALPALGNIAQIASFILQCIKQ